MSIDRFLSYINDPGLLYCSDEYPYLVAIDSLHTSTNTDNLKGGESKLFILNERKFIEM